MLKREKNSEQVHDAVKKNGDVNTTAEANNCNTETSETTLLRQEIGHKDNSNW